MKKFYDISMSIFPEMTVWKDSQIKKPEIEIIQDYQSSSSYGSRLHLDAHTGTHIDAPLHMLPEGATIETIALERLVGRCRVLDLTHAEHSIGKAELTAFSIQPGEKIVMKTRNSKRSESDPFDSDFVFLNEEGARFLSDIGVELVGTDALGIERSQTDHATHKLLFDRDIVILEGLRLEQIEPREYLLVAAPLKLIGTEAAPARVLLFDL